MKKLVKHVRELSHAYYHNHARRLKKVEKALNSDIQQQLLTRYCLKVMPPCSRTSYPMHTTPTHL